MRAVLFLALLSAGAAHAQVSCEPCPDPDAIRAHRTASYDARDTTALPLRSVREAAALAPAFRRDLATGALVFRSAVSREPVFVVDGVRRLGGPLGASTASLLGAPEVPFAAVQRVYALGGFVPATLGEAAGGIVRVTTEAGAERFAARIEGLSSEATDAFGASVASATVRGPLGRLGGVSVTGEVRHLGDAVPSAGTSIRLTDAAAARVAASPQSVLVTDASGATRLVPFPTAAALAAIDAGRPFTLADLDAALPAGSRAVSPEVVEADLALAEADIVRQRAQGDPLRDLALHGQVVFAPARSVDVRLGGGVVRRTAAATAPTPGEAFGRRLLGPAGLSRQTVDGAHAFGEVVADVTDRVTARLRGSAEWTASVLHPGAFSSDVADALFYGDVDAEANAEAGRAVVFHGGEYVRQYTTDGGAFPSRGLTGFALPGSPASVYDRQQAASLQAGAGIEARLGGHRVEAGAEAERQTFRRFTLNGRRLAWFAADADGGTAVPGFPDGVARYDQLGFEILSGSVSTYGYTFNGLDETTGEDVEGYLARVDTDIAPFRPVTAAGYVRDRFEVGPAAFDLGLRLDVYDARATTLFDPYATVPIERAGDVASAPAGIASDFAVYRAGGQPGGTPVGYRDRDGQFYDATGNEATADEVVSQRRGQVVQTDAPRSEAYGRTRATVRLQPRLGVRVQATDAVALTGYAVRLSRRPDPAFYVPFTVYDIAGFRAVPGSAALRPEDVWAGGLGVEAAVSPRVTLGAAAFARQHRRLPVVRRFDGGFPAYVGVTDAGRRDEAGLDLTLNLSRTRGVAVRAAYTLAVARSSDADGLSNLVIRDSGILDDLTTAAGDTRHALDIAADLRVPAGAGPRLGGVAPFGGLGIGLVFAAQSGLPYTALQANTGFAVFDPFTPDVTGEFNGARLPWTRQLDVRVERRVALGAAALTAFVWAENVLGTRNPLAVYRATGQPDTDGFPDTPSGQQVLVTPGAVLGYAAYTGGPVNVGGAQSTGAPFVYGQPRQVRLGVVLGL